jgi:hypothetical protein
MTTTGTPPAEIRTVIESRVNGFNTQNAELFLSIFGDTAIIIAGIAPYRWSSPNAAGVRVFETPRPMENRRPGEGTHVLVF